MAKQIRTRRGRIRMLVISTALAALTVLPAGAAFGQTDPYSGNGPEVLPTRISNEQPNDGGDVVAGTSLGEERPSGVLPFTGADITLFLVTGLAAIGTGTLIARRAQL